MSLAKPTFVVIVIVGASLLSACRTVPVPIRFAPPNTDSARLRSDYALTDTERQALTPKMLQQMTQEQVDQVYERLAPGPIPDGPFRGDLFVPKNGNRHARLSDMADPVPDLLAHVAALPLENFGRALWKGKVFFRSQGILRNRIDDLAILKPIIRNTDSIPKLTFDGQTTWLLFPAQVSCGDSQLDPTRHSIVIDYTRGPEIEGYREVPDKLAGADGLKIRDEIRAIRPGFYLGRAYFGPKFGLNFTLVDPTLTPAASVSGGIPEDCDSRALAK